MADGSVIDISSEDEFPETLATSSSSHTHKKRKQSPVRQTVSTSAPLKKKQKTQLEKDATPKVTKTAKQPAPAAPVLSFPWVDRFVSEGGGAEMVIKGKTVEIANCGGTIMKIQRCKNVVDMLTKLDAKLKSVDGDALDLIDMRR